VECKSRDSIIGSDKGFPHKSMGLFLAECSLDVVVWDYFLLVGE
jgi:hypothetical protein